jgi:DNA-binding NarL/FixJ family response regulator
MEGVQPRAIDGGQLTLVLVEDHAAVRDQITIQLAKAGVEVVEAVGTMWEGEVAVRAHRPAVAVIDNRLPDGLGVDLCRRLSVDLPDVALILHTGVVPKSLLIEAEQAGVRAVVAKSIRGTSLLEAVLVNGPARRAIRPARPIASREEVSPNEVHADLPGATGDGDR